MSIISVLLLVALSSRLLFGSLCLWLWWVLLLAYR
jgi:hypothetical protein